MASSPLHPHPSLLLCNSSSMLSLTPRAFSRLMSGRLQFLHCRSELWSPGDVNVFFADTNGWYTVASWRHPLRHSVVMSMISACGHRTCVMCHVCLSAAPSAASNQRMTDQAEVVSIVNKVLLVVKSAVAFPSSAAAVAAYMYSMHGTCNLMHELTLRWWSLL